MQRGIAQILTLQQHVFECGAYICILCAQFEQRKELRSAGMRGNTGEATLLLQQRIRALQHRHIVVIHVSVLIAPQPLRGVVGGINHQIIVGILQQIKQQLAVGRAVVVFEQGNRFALVVAVLR